MEARAPYPYYRKKAVQHGEAMRIRRVKDTLAQVRQDIKEKRLKREEVDFEAILAGCPEFNLRCDPMEFSEIGCELPLYFAFLRWLAKQMCFYVVAGTVLVFALYWPVCYAKSYRENWWNPGPMSCEGRTTLPMSLICSLMFWLTYREVLKHREQQKDLARAIDADTIAPSDYAVLVRDLPKDATETEVEVFFVKRGFESKGGIRDGAPEPTTPASTLPPTVALGNAVSPFSSLRQEKHLPTSTTATNHASVGSYRAKPSEVQVVKVMMCKDCTEVTRLRKQRQKLLKKQASMEKRQGAPEAVISEVRRQIAEVTNQLGNRSLVDAAASTGTAIVIFKSQDVQRRILEHWNFVNDPGCRMLATLDRLGLGLLSRLGLFHSGLPKFRGKRISVRRADNPTNIKWENIAVPNHIKALGTLASWFVMFLILAVDYWLAYTALLWKKDQVSQDHTLATFAISLLIAGFISFMNLFLCLVAYALAPLERHATESGADKAVMQKLALALVINTCIIQLLVNSEREDWGGPSGLAQQIFSMCLSNAMAPLVRLLDSMGMLRMALRLKWEYDMTEDGPLSEADVEKYYSFYLPSSIELPVIYAKAISTFFLAMVYVPLLPITAPLLCLASFVAQYFADKVFATRYARKPYTSTRASNARAALDLVGNGILLSSLFAGGFIGYSGRDSWATLLVGLTLGCLLFVVYLLPRPYQYLIFRLSIDSERQVDTATEASYYDAQLAWPEQDQYHTTYPLYQSCNDMPANFDEMGVFSRKLWELRLWVAFSPQEEESRGFFMAREKQKDEESRGFFGGREKEKDRPFWSPKASNKSLWSRG